MTQRLGQTLSIHQLMAMRSLFNMGWPDDLVDKLLLRCGTSQEEWQDLVNTELVFYDSEHRWRVSSTGLRVYNQESKGKYF